MYKRQIADITGKSFSIVKDPRNAGAVGAAVVALIGLGELSGFGHAKEFVQIDKVYQPDRNNKAVYDQLFLTYKEVYKSLEQAYKFANGERFRHEENGQ